MELQEIGHGIKGIDDLVEIAIKANPLMKLPEETDEIYTEWLAGDVTIPSVDGWKVTFYYDMMLLDYIDSFITPSGEKISLCRDDNKLKEEIADEINKKWEIKVLGV